MVGKTQQLTPRRPHRPLKRFTFQRDTASQLALRLTMRRIAATLAVVVALLFVAGLAWADDKSEANKLFVDAVGLIMSVEETKTEDGTTEPEPPTERLNTLQQALNKLFKIFDDYPGTDLAVKLISRTGTGIYTLDNVTELLLNAKGPAVVHLATERG